MNYKFFSEHYCVQGIEDTKCIHHDCDCDYVLRGLPDNPVTRGITLIAPRYLHGIRQTRESQLRSIMSQVYQNFRIHNETVVRSHRSGLEEELSNIIKNSKNMVRIEPPVRYDFMPTPVHHVLHPDIEKVMTYLDIYAFKKLGLVYPNRMSWFYENEVEFYMDRGQVPSLQMLAWNEISPYKQAFSTYMGRPIAISSTHDLHSKIIASIALMDRDQSVPACTKEILDMIPMAKKLLYNALGTEQFIGKIPVTISVEDDVEVMPMDTGAGINAYPSETKQADGVTVQISGTSKKRENVDASLAELLAWVETGRKPFFSWSTRWKYETKIIDRMSRKEARAWEKFCSKVRIFIIPNLSYILLERILSNPRIKLDKRRIRIGHKWVWGGMEELFHILNPDGAKRRYFDGDFSKWDHSLKRLLMEIYFQDIMKYFDKESDPDMYDLFVVMARHMAQACFDRVQHLVRQIWVRINGELPSGMYETSHGGSWINLFLWCWFCVTRISKMSPSDQRKAWKDFARAVIYIVYGDDHVLSLWDDQWWLKHFSYYDYVTWLKTHHGMSIQDIHETTEFHTTVSKDGQQILRRGIIFLRHYAVVNPDSRPGQAKYIPWRPVNEILPKVVWGREPGPRDLCDMALSLIGHAYGSYGSNEVTYDYLSHIWDTISMFMKRRGTLHLSVLVAAEKRWDLKRYKQYGLDPDNFDGNFPSLQTLRDKNFYKREEHVYAFVVNNQ